MYIIMKIDQDVKQRIQTGLNFALESYKILMGAFLLFFVPQVCNIDTIDEDTCSYYDIVARDSILTQVGLLFNILTCCQLIVLYYIELKRENWSIHYLDMDDSKSQIYLDNEIEKYPTYKKYIHKLNRLYRINSISSLIFVIVNTVLSTYTIYQYNDGMASYTMLFNYLILLFTKLGRCYTNAYNSIKSDRMYSAYLVENKTYNTIDKDFKIPIPYDILIEYDTTNSTNSNNSNSECNSVFETDNNLEPSQINIQMDEHNETITNEDNNIISRKGSSDKIGLNYDY
jgi:hypothetical protein